MFSGRFGAQPARPRSALMRWLSPPVFPGDEIKTRNAAILNALLITTLLTQLLMPLYYCAGNRNLISPCLWISEVIVALIVLRRGYVQAASILTLAASWVILNYTVATLGGVRSPAFSGHLIIAGCAGILLGWRSLLAMVAASIVAGLGLMVLEYQHLLPDCEPRSPLVEWLTYAVIFVVGAVQLGIAMHILGRAVERERAEHAERDRAEQALRESEARYRTLVENAPEAISVIDVQANRFVSANANALKLFGLSLDALLRTNPIELSPAKQPDGRSSEEAAKVYIQMALDGKTPWFEWAHRDSRGREIPCEIQLALMPSTGGPPLVQGCSVDVSERKRLEAHLLQAQKMESVGHLAGGLAHDFNNLLAVILSSADLVEMKIGAHPAAAHITDLRRASLRASQLTRQLLAFSRKQVLQPTVLNLNAVISETERMLRRLIGEHIEMRLDLQHDTANVKVDRTQVEQVIVNLAVNARDAMAKGGVLTIRTRNLVVTADAPESALPAGASLPPGNYVMLEVSDTGSGIDPAAKAHLFEPFFTTKEVGQGTGLGLSTVHGIVKQSGGQIVVVSEPGDGASFQIYLPAASAALTPHPTPPSQTSTGKGDETVLIAEDNPMTLNVAVSSLQAFGYKVLRAENPLMALQLAKSYAGKIHILLTDVIMPKMNGRQLAQEVRDLRPEIKVLYTSGYPRDVIVNQGVLEEGIELIEKPFTPDTLARRIRGVLDAPVEKAAGGTPAPQ